MQISARLMADAAVASRSAPAPVVVLSAPTAALEPNAAPGPSEPSVVVVQPGAAPDITITVENEQVASVEDNDEAAEPAPEPAGGGPEPEPDKPGVQGVELLGISSEVWTQLLVALGLLATAVAGWLGREKIPGVKEVTKKVRAVRDEKKAAKDAKDAEIELEDEEPE
jgi:hypothetical protein